MHACTMRGPFRIRGKLQARVASRVSTKTKTVELDFDNLSRVDIIKYQHFFQSNRSNNKLWPAVFRNTKEIPKNTKENQPLICFADFFLLNEVINLIP